MMLRYLPVSLPLMVIFVLLFWTVDLLWLKASALAILVFLQGQIYVFTRAEARSDANTHVYSCNWRPAEGILILMFALSCFVGMFMLFVSMFLTHFVAEADLARTREIAKALLFTSSGILLIYELSLPATKLEA